MWPIDVFLPHQHVALLPQDLAPASVCLVHDCLSGSVLGFSDGGAASFQGRSAAAKAQQRRAAAKARFTADVYSSRTVASTLSSPAQPLETRAADGGY
jgi:hypothetical protein